MKAIFYIKDKKFEVPAEEGLSLLEIAQSNSVDLDGNCGGSMACGSCHVIVKEEWVSKITKAIEDEEDVLDVIFGVKKNSRLACQIFFTKELDGIEVEIPCE